MSPNTTARCVHTIRHWVPGRPCSGQRSSDVLPHQFLPSPCRQPVRHIFFQPRAILSTPDRRSVTFLLLQPLVDLGRPAEMIDDSADTVLAGETKREIPAQSTGFRPCLCVSRRILFLCCCRARASSWGQARPGAVTDASFRAAAANVAGEYRIGFSKRPRSFKPLSPRACVWRRTAASVDGEVPHTDLSMICAHPVPDRCPLA